MENNRIWVDLFQKVCLGKVFGDLFELRKKRIE